MFSDQSHASANEYAVPGAILFTEMIFSLLPVINKDFLVSVHILTYVML